ncbi:helix-turn-helix transcriptional regulator [Marinibaculum pumilum]|uniref:Helix-turn-helix transcriptional regulator n=1 Tax=Marinibaculum pumilum TaxID=1766165 RepID=A0ABV7KWG4_9PROT
MRRADRLIELVGYLRAGQPVTADALALRLELSVRTVYRDIAALQGQGFAIDGQAGIGYLARAPLDLPPLTFDHDEMEALALGLAYVRQVGDRPLAAAARSASVKIEAARRLADPTRPALRAVQKPHRRAPGFAAALRRAVRERRLVSFAYRSQTQAETRRRVRPLALTAFSDGWLLVGWCLLREDFRLFRLDRISDLEVQPDRFDDEPGRDLAAYTGLRGDGRPAGRAG